MKKNEANKILIDLVEYLQSNECEDIRAIMRGEINNIDWCTKEELYFILTLNKLKKLL